MLPPLLLLFLHLLLVPSIMAAAVVASSTSKPAQVDDINTFLTMAWQVARLARPNASCYVCGLVPFTAGEGLPLMALPASDCDACRLLHVARPRGRPECPRVAAVRPLDCSGARAGCQRCARAPAPVPVLLVPRPFRWCLENDGERPVGESRCLNSFGRGRGRSHANFLSPDSPADGCLRAAGEARLSALAHRAASCSISSPAGMYWVCGNLAYPYLPVDYRGRCGLAYVVPAMRVAQALPRTPRPGGRRRRGASDVFGTHHQTAFKNGLGSLLPFYGVMSALDQIADLSHAVEFIANETGRALALISGELASLRLLALQNRAALDFLLAAQGGTCSVVGSECCTFVPDHNATIADIVGHLRDAAAAAAAATAHQDAGSVSDWLSSLLGPASRRLLQVVLLLAVFVVMVSLFMSCVKRFLFGIK